MANYTFGFIGTGNMGSALAKAAVKHVSPDMIILSNRTALAELHFLSPAESRTTLTGRPESGSLRALVLPIR